MKFNIGEVVNHKSMFGQMIIIARCFVESFDEKENICTERVYRCRTSYGDYRDFMEFELVKRNKEE